MPKLDEPTKIERSPIPAGKHVLTLKGVKDYEGKNTFEAPTMNEETGEMEYAIRREWIWQFESNAIDPKTKRPYEYAVWTSRFFNPTSDRNKLTQLIRHLAPEATDEERKAMIEMDHLIGKRWNARLIKATSKNGKEYITHTSFDPIEETPDFDPDDVPA